MATILLPPDFKEFLQLLYKHQVDYLLIGGYVVGDSMKPVFYKGQLTTWNDDRGFGFIQPGDGGAQAFLHISALTGQTRRPKAGDMIYYQLTSDRDGRARACNAFIEIVTSEIKRGSLMVWLETLALSALSVLGSIHFLVTYGIPVPLILYPTMSLLTFGLYAGDKAHAKQGGWRVPESMLHVCELFGGWLGAFVAQRKLHHKSSKISYQVTFWTIVVAHNTFWLVWLFYPFISG